MTESEALKKLELVCSMMILCREQGLNDKAEQYAGELHNAYSEWFSAWRDNEFNTHR